MKRSYILTIRISLIALISIVILGYGLFQARDLIRGPEITVIAPQNGTDHTDPLVIVSGSASNINHISMDDRPIFIDKLGNFSEKLLLQPGYNIIKLAAQDRFGRTKQKLLELNYTPTDKVDVIMATSTFSF